MFIKLNKLSLDADLVSQAGLQAIFQSQRYIEAPYSRMGNPNSDGGTEQRRGWELGRTDDQNKWC